MPYDCICEGLEISFVGEVRIGIGTAVDIGIK